MVTAGSPSNGPDSTDSSASRAGTGQPSGESPPRTAPDSAPGPEQIATRADFPSALAVARTRSGPLLRELGRVLGLPASTVSGWMTGRHLPNLRQLDQLRRLLAELGIAQGEHEQWVESLQRVRTAPGPRPADTAPPFRGLDVFEIEDAPRFFGGDRLVDSVLAKLDEARRVPAGPQLVVVVGASGSGKSSMLRAGVAARLVAGSTTAGPTTVGVVTPGERGVERLAEVLAGLLALPVAQVATALHGCPAELAAQLAVHNAVLIVDQVEEMFTHGTSATQADEFVSMLLALADVRSGVPVVLATRAGLLSPPRRDR